MWDGIAEMEENRSSLLMTIESMATQRAIDEYKRIEPIIERAGLSHEDKSTIYDAVCQAAQIAFEEGLRLYGAYCQVDSACEVAVREYRAMIEDNGKG